MAAEPMTNEDLRAAAELLELDSPGTWTRSERNAIIAATAAAARRLLEEVQRLKAKLAAAANTIAAPAVQLAEIGALVGYPDPPGIADAVRAELAARDASIAALSERCTAKGLELDRVIREAAADKAKLATIAADTLDKLADTLENLPPGGEALKGPHWYREGIKAAAGIARDEAYHLRPAAPEMPRPPAEDALGAVKTPGADTGRGTNVAEAENSRQAIDSHGLKWDTIARTVIGCRCGFEADESSDCGFGDSVVAHLLALPSLPVPSTEEQR